MVLYFESSRLILSSHFLMPYTSSLILLVLKSFEKIHSFILVTYFLLVLKLLKLQFDLSLGLQLSYLFSKYFIEWRIRKRSLFYYSTLIRWNISSPVRYWYLSILRENYADIFAPSLLISYCSFLSLILSSIVMINYILSKRFFLKREELSDARLVSITKKEYGFEVPFL